MPRLRLKQDRTYKSVGNLNSLLLPALTVLAGVNGAGKTHLLQAIKDGAVRAYIDDTLVATDDIVLYDWSSFSITTTGPARMWAIGQRRERLLDSIKSQTTAGNAFALIQSHPERVGRQLTEKDLLRSPLDTLELAEDLASKVDAERRTIRDALVGALNTEQQDIVRAIESLTGQLIVELDKRTLAASIDMVGDRVDPLRLRSSDVFLAYRDALDRNDLARFRAADGGVDSYVSQPEFELAYGPAPWDVLNSLLTDLSLDFQVDNPASGDDTYEVALVQQTSGVNVPFTDLSSGEQVLMALAISLYGSIDSRHRIMLPKVMLLDEIDAPLHPAMTRMYFRVVNDLLVANNVVVVVATHNPSTVALAPEGSVRRMTKDEPRLVEVTNQQALADLTAGVTALTVRFNERRVVLVEGNSDADAYTAVLDALSSQLDNEYGIAFVSSGLRAGEGGAAVVKENVRILRDAGAETIYGLIDRDGMPSPSADGTVVVLGPSGRYTLENYLLDPLLLAALAVREKFSHQIPGLEDLLISRVGTWRGLDAADGGTLQDISDLMLSMIAANAEPAEPALTAELVGGRSIMLPRWFIDIPGHTLFEKWTHGIPRFRAYPNEGALRTAVLKLVVGDVPQLLSRDFLEVMATLAGHDPARTIDH